MAKTGNVWIKRAAIGVGGLFALFVAAAIIVPLVVNIDQYRPEIVKIANENINGKLDIGKMSLSLWGQVEIDIDGVKLEDAGGQKLISVEETYAQISFLSILAGKPKLVFRMVEPEVNVVKDQAGKLNLLSIVKETPDAPPPEQPEQTEDSGAGLAGDSAIIGMVAAAGVDVELLKAKIQFKDFTSGFTQDVNDFNIRLLDISMTRPMSLLMSADIGTKLVDVIKLDGPFEITGKITPEFEGVSFKQVAIDMNLNFDDIAIDMGETMQKAAGLPTNIAIKMSASPEFVDIASLVVKFHNAVLNAAVKVNDLQGTDPKINFDLKSEPIDLSEWGKLVTALKGLELEGRMDMAATANGALSKLAYTADLDIKDMVANAPGLLARPKMQVGVNVITNEVKQLRFDFDAPGTDIKVRGNLKNFSAPKVKVAMNSGAIDLDQLLPPPPEPPASEGGKKTSGGGSGGSGGGKGAAAGGAGAGASEGAADQPATDVDKSLEGVRENTFLKSIVANVAVNIKKFKGMNIDASDILVNFSFKDLVASIDKFNINIFKGMVKANANVDIKPSSPIYRMNLNVNQIDLQTAIESQMESLRNTVIGRLSFKASGGGKSLNSDKILPNLDLSGRFKMNEAEFASVDIGKMVTEGVNGSIGDIKKKVPPLADKSVKTPKNYKSKYDEISSDFTLKGGVFTAPNFKTVSKKKQGIDLDGRTVADLVNDKLDADWLVIDTYNVTKAHDVSINMNGVKVDHVLAEKGKPVSFPVKVGCKLSEPCYQYDQVAKHLGQIALNNVRGAAGEKVKKQVDAAKKKAKEEMDKRKREAKARADKEKAKARKKAKEKAKKQGEKLKKRFGF